MAKSQFLRLGAKEATGIILKNPRSGWNIIDAPNASSERPETIAALGAA
jgi:hypothetical protein